MGTTAATMPRRRLRAVPLRTLGDDRLARLAAQGDREAFAAIFERHHQGIFRYCRSLVADADDAADALQNTMAAALRAIDGEQRDLTVKPWLYRIAHNESISLLRRRRPHAELDDEIAETTAERCDGAGSRERLRQLVADLGELPERQRGALVMRELSGLSYDEIASAFGMSAGTAKQTVYEARQGLHDLVEGRAMLCDSVRELISANDGRRLSGRRVRSHLRDCASCRAFEDEIKTRGRQLPMLAPPLAPLAAGHILQGLLGGSGGDGGAGGGLLSLIGGASSKTGVAGMGVKGLAVAAVAASAGAAGVSAGTLSVPFKGKPDQHAVAPERRPAPVGGVVPERVRGEHARRDRLAGTRDDSAEPAERRSDKRREASAEGRPTNRKERPEQRMRGDRGGQGSAGQSPGRPGAHPTAPGSRAGGPSRPAPPTRPSQQPSATGPRPPQSPVPVPVAPSPQPTAPQPAAPAPESPAAIPAVPPRPGSTGAGAPSGR